MPEHRSGGSVSATINVNSVTEWIPDLAEGSFDRAAHARDNPKIREDATMSNVEQFEKAVADAGAVVMRIMRGSRGSERLLIQTPGGLITREVALQGDISEDIQAATISAMEIVASARRLTSPPARNLCPRIISERSAETSTPIANRSSRRP
jgi:hypothetical protein